MKYLISLLLLTTFSATASANCKDYFLEIASAEKNLGHDEALLDNATDKRMFDHNELLALHKKTIRNRVKMEQIKIDFITSCRLDD
jgi:hypothetical protein